MTTDRRPPAVCQNIPTHIETSVSVNALPNPKETASNDPVVAGSTPPPRDVTNLVHSW
jgi:hypothetical protein